MPGVPPDALNQVKKGLKGLFSRKRRDKTHASQQPTESSTTPVASSSSHAGAIAGTATGATAAGAATTAQPPTTTTSSPTPQLSTPANIAESQNIDLNPAASSAHQHHHQPTTEKTEKTTPAPLTVKEPAEGMSATSGPLSDDLGGGYNTAMSSPTGHAHGSHPETSLASKGTTGAGEGEAAKVEEVAKAVEEGGGGKALPDAPAS